MFKTSELLRKTLLGTAILAWSVSASGDIKAYHGAMCRNATQLGSRFDYEAFDRGFFNIDDSQVIGVCPLIRDRVNASNNITSVVVEGYNAKNRFDPGASDYTCTLISQTEDALGSTLDTHTLRTETLGFVQLGSFFVDTSAGNEGSYALRCNLDKNEGIYHVFVNENNGAD